jgi:hypothetical protein
MEPLSEGGLMYLKPLPADAWPATAIAKPMTMGMKRFINNATLLKGR